MCWDVGQKPAELAGLEQSICVQVGSAEGRKLKSVSVASQLRELRESFTSLRKGRGQQEE